jgi:hypothetical protein
MSILRVEQDSVEFFTVEATGLSGMSQIGLSRLVGISHQSISDLIANIIAGRSRSKCFKPFSGKDFILQAQVTINGKNIPVSIIPAHICAVIINYYAFISDYKTETAYYSSLKFTEMGIERWIQGITGWKSESTVELTEDAVIDFIADRLEPGMIAAGIQTDALIEMLKRGDFTGSGCRLYFYLEMMHLQGETPSDRQICKDLKIAPSTLRKWLPKIHAWSRCADWLQLQARKGPEYPIQLRMHEELGGKMEAFTVAGRIDLVTDTEVIEIKQIAQWKDAVGEVLSKGQFFPKHHKRIHLFGAADKLMEVIVASCSVLEIVVTFEAVEAGSGFN